MTHYSFQYFFSTCNFMDQKRVSFSFNATTIAPKMSKALFIWRKVVAGGRITLLPERHCMGEPILFIDFLTKRSEPFTWLAPPDQLQWRIQGRARPLFFDQNEARRVETNFLGDRPRPLSQGLDDRPPFLI